MEISYYCTNNKVNQAKSRNFKDFCEKFVVKSSSVKRSSHYISCKLILNSSDYLN